MRRNIFYIIACTAVVATSFLFWHQRSRYESAACPDNCSYWESLAIWRGRQDIREISPFNLAREEYGDVWYMLDGLAQKVTYQGEEINFMQFSPSKKFIGFYHNQLGDERAGKDVVLEIMNVNTKETTTVYQGDYQTSMWEWIDGDTVRVYINVGAGVRVYHDIDITAEIPFISADYMDPEFWTPEKTF